MTDISLEKAKKSVYPLLLGEKLRARLDEMAAYYEKSVAETIRDAVNYLYLEKYMKNARGYGKGTEAPVTRETQAERRNRLEAMSDADLNAELDSLHAFDEYKSGPDMLVFVDTDPLGRRILRQRSASEDNETPLAMFLNQLKNKKII